MFTPDLYNVFEVHELVWTNVFSKGFYDKVSRRNFWHVSTCWKWLKNAKHFRIYLQQAKKLLKVSDHIFQAGPFGFFSNGKDRKIKLMYRKVFQRLNRFDILKFRHFIALIRCRYFQILYGFLPHFSCWFFEHPQFSRSHKSSFSLSTYTKCLLNFEKASRQFCLRRYFPFVHN